MAASVPSKSNPANPASFLPDICMFQVMEFVGPQEEITVGGTRIETTSPMALAKFCNSMALVSPDWKKLMDRLVAHFCFRVLVDFDDLVEREIPAVMWLCNHKVKLWGIQCTKNNIDEFKFNLIKQTLLECNTTQLTYASTPSLQCDFESNLAEQCPNLETLSIRISLEDLKVMNDHCKGLEEHSGFNPVLLRHESVKHVKMSFDIQPKREATSLPPFDIHKHILSKLIQGWVGLTSLCLESTPCHDKVGEELFGEMLAGVWNGHGPEISINSESLEKFVVNKFQLWDHTRFILVCPALQACSYKAESNPGALYHFLGISRTRSQTVQNLSEGCDVSIEASGDAPLIQGR
ncbi:expressed unknown protein [Seminavis robusta]|uniref:Uncharacterized protein n=1 Tax=Seminavis robusta TaxID=568900 RepID=A0A9N8HXY6_9STRA|nr:expressed unknown protein [Seminavis robusta]|eukprot:Sro2344_g324140.1 n/a (350) ;mRNA; r:21-1154